MKKKKNKFKKKVFKNINKQKTKKAFKKLNKRNIKKTTTKPKSLSGLKRSALALFPRGPRLLSKAVVDLGPFALWRFCPLEITGLLMN